ncbi:MAG: tandem-95 repeat protein, partial [Pirellulaceae bacterium]|nr:tandem-95 repeat protein [Pirellulaceae bacterium]
IAAINNTNVELGSPFHVPVDAYDPNGNPLTVTVTSSNSSVIEAEVVPAGDRSMRIRVKDFGDMVFKLYETEAATPVNKIIELASAGYYTNSEFHRVINNFMIQTGIGATTVDNINDQFNVNLQHNRSGVLSYAKTSADDTGSSQFFITEVPTRHLDFHHAVFGQLIEGDAVREAISNVATSSGDAPNIDIVIESVTIFTDNENGLVRLKAKAATGTSNITVTVTDTEGNSTSQSFVATAIADAANGAPFLNPIPSVTTTINTPATINLTSQYAENDVVTYSVAKVSAGDYQVSVVPGTGVVTVTPATDFVGTIQFRASVQQTVASATSAPAVDTQLVTVVVNGANAPTGIDLDTASDTGASSTDNITNAAAPTFTVSGTTSGATVRLKVGNTVIGQATATGTTTVVTANNIAGLGTGAVLVTATQTTGGAEGSPSPALSVNFDRVAPVDVASNLIPASAQIGQPLSVNLAHAEEGQGLIYTIENAPAGLTINSSTGVIAWTPIQSQLGTQTFNLKLTDTAGNEKTQAISINVIEAPLAKVILEVVDMQGNPITQVATGQQFRVRFLTQDMRGFSANGVFGSYIDLLFDPNVVEPIATGAITYAAPFDNGKSPTPSTPTIAGQINELGAFGGLSRTDGEPKLIATVTFTAKAAGNPNIRSEAADVVGSDILLFDRTLAVPPANVDYGRVDLAVGANFQVANDAFNFNEDATVQSLNVLSNDTVTGTATLTITSVGTSNGPGTVTVAADGKSLNYTPGANFSGAESFTYTVRNQDNVSLTATVTIQIAEVNDPPLANNDVAEFVTGSSNNVINVLANDATGVDAPALETLRVSAVGTPSNGGTVQVGSSGLNILYTPRAGFVGTETVTYTLSDGRGGTATGTVSISVKVANPPPTAVNDAFTGVEDAAEASFNVTTNDTPDAGETISISAVSSSSRGSTLRISADAKQVLYKPGPNINGSEVLTYTLRDSGGATAIGTVTFTITAVNDAPDAFDDVRSVLSSTGNSNLDVLVNDVNVDTGENLEITAVTQPPTGQGTISISTDKKSLIYAPPSTDCSGTVVFSYTVSDGTLTDSASVTLNVQNFIPRSIGGSLSSSSIPSQTPALGGIDLQLVGTDLTGAARTLTLSTNRQGAFEANNLAPGTYTISRPALPFLEDSGDSMTITSAAADTSNTSLKSTIGGLKAQHISIRHFLGSASVNSVLFAVAPGNGESWYAVRNGLTGFSNIQGRLDAAVTTLTVTATNASNQNVSTALPLNDPRVTVLATEGDARLLRVTGAADTLGFQTVTTSSASGEGEGGSTNQSQNANSTGRGLSTSGLKAEGEAAPDVASSTATSHATSLSPSQALRQVLGSQQNLSTSSLVSATTHLQPGAVDSALSEIDTLSLASSEVDALTADDLGTENQVDSALLSL